MSQLIQQYRRIATKDHLSTLISRLRKRLPNTFTCWCPILGDVDCQFWGTNWVRTLTGDINYVSEGTTSGAADLQELRFLLSYTCPFDYAILKEVTLIHRNGAALIQGADITIQNADTIAGQYDNVLATGTLTTGAAQLQSSTIDVNVAMDIRNQSGLMFTVQTGVRQTNVNDLRISGVMLVFEYKHNIEES
jgi:hypothetical protein